MDKQVEDMIPVCKMCGQKLGVFVSKSDKERQSAFRTTTSASTDEGELR